MQGSVPKFGSFKPKVERGTDEKVPDGNQDVDQARSRHQSHHKHRSASQKSDKRLPDAQKRDAKPRAPSSNLQHGYTDELFNVDHKGDGDNARYGSNSRWQVPRYREPLERSLIGTGGESRGRVGGSILARLSREDRAQLMSSGRLVTAKSSNPALHADEELLEDFIPLRDGSRQKRLSSRMQVLGIDWDEQVSGSSSDSSEDSSEEKNPELQGPQSMLQQKLSRLQDAVKKAPSDLNSWLELVDFQDIWVREGMSTEAPLSGLELRSTVTKLRLDLVDDAMKAVGPDTRKQQILGLRQLAIGSSIWDHSVLSQRWLHFLEKSGRSSSALEAYITYRLSNAEDFEFEQIRDLYKELFKTHNGDLAGKDTRKNLFRHVHAVTSFLRNSGYREAAVAVWQASIYANLREFRLEEDSTPPEGADLEAWWDSEQPRPGKQGSISVTSPQPNPDLSPDPERKQDVDRWTLKELASMSRAWVPGRAEDEGDGDEEDAYRIVLYPDIDIFVQKWESAEALLNTFLLFCGLPPIFMAEDYKSYRSPVQSQPARGLKDTVFWSGSQRTHILSSQSWLADAQCLWGAEDYVYASFRHVSKDDKLARMAANVLEQRVTATIREIPQEGDLVEYFFALLCHLEPSIARRKARSLLDEGRSRCMRLYLCLALIELKLKGAAKADAIFVAAIKMSNHVQKEQPSEKLRLWNAWIWSALGDGNKEVALHRLLSVALEDAPPELVSLETASPARIIKTQNYLRQVRDDALTDQSWSEALQAGKMLITLAFLTTLSIPSAVAMLATNVTYFSTYISDRSSIIVALHQHLALLFHAHVTLRLGPYSPDSLATALAPSITSLPTNGLLLNIYAEVFAHGTRLDDRVRAIARRILHVDARPDLDSMQQKSHSSAETVEDDSSQSIVPQLFAIQNELSRQTELGSTSSSIRAVFEQALENDQSRHSQVVWAVYLDYECLMLASVQQEPLDQSTPRSDRLQRKLAVELSAAREKVRGIFYRGVHALPASKDWIMRGLSLPHIQSVLTLEERRLLVDRISDRGLRLHQEPAGT